MSQALVSFTCLAASFLSCHLAGGEAEYGYLLLRHIYIPVRCQSENYAVH